MKTELETSIEINYEVGQKWKNTENDVEFIITDIGENIISLDDGKRKMSSTEHINKNLWNHLIKEGYYKEVL